MNRYVITSKGVAAERDAAAADIIREISSREDLEELIERMPYIRTIQAPNSRIRKEFYQAAMKQYDDLEWVKVIKSVHLRVEENHYEEFELEYLEKAKRFLYGEIAAAFRIPFEDVEEFLNETIERQLKEF